MVVKELIDRSFIEQWGGSFELFPGHFSMQILFFKVSRKFLNVRNWLLSVSVLDMVLYLNKMIKV